MPRDYTIYSKADKDIMRAKIKEMTDDRKPTARSVKEALAVEFPKLKMWLIYKLIKSST